MEEYRQRINNGNNVSETNQNSEALAERYEDLMNELDKLHIFEEDVPEHVQFNNLRLYDFME